MDPADPGVAQRSIDLITDLADNCSAGTERKFRPVMTGVCRGR
jgi:hypothetical protein